MAFEMLEGRNLSVNAGDVLFYQFVYPAAS